MYKIFFEIFLKTKQKFSIILVYDCDIIQDISFC